MFKKVLPLVFMSGLVLAACNNNGDNGNNGNNGNNGAVPNNNETPMENLEDRTGDWTPDLNGNNGNNGQTGPDLDGIDNGNDNRVRDGIIDGTDMNNGIDNGDTTTTPRDNVNDDDLNNNRKNNNNMNGTNNR